MNQPTNTPDPDNRPPSSLVIGHPSTGRTTAPIAALAQAFNAADSGAVVVLDPKGELGPYAASGSDR
ncbi:MAG: hypothetical protein Q7T55_06435 [Solirubrobacteraceae bacterium]|nr:hypothetical protein [Solirubrobacteraceae bacterium]